MSGLLWLLVLLPAASGVLLVSGGVAGSDRADRQAAMAYFQQARRRRLSRERSGGLPPPAWPSEPRLDHLEGLGVPLARRHSEAFAPDPSFAAGAPDPAPQVRAG